MDELGSNKRNLDKNKEISAEPLLKKRRLPILRPADSAPMTETAKAQHYLRSLETQHGGIFARGSENLAHDSSSRPLECGEARSLSEEDQAHLDTIKELSKLALSSRKKLSFFQPILAYRESQQPDQGMMQKALDRWKEFSQSSKGDIAWEHLTNNAFWSAFRSYKFLTEDKHDENLFKDLDLKDKETINKAVDKIQWEDLEKVINEDVPAWKDEWEQKGKKFQNHVVRTTYHLRNLNIYHNMSNLNPLYENALRGTLMQFVADAYEKGASSQKLGAEKTYHSDESGPEAPSSPDDQHHQTTLPQNSEKIRKGESRKILIQAISKILNQQDLKRIRTILEKNDLIESDQRELTESQEASTSSGKQQEGSFSEKRAILKQETAFLQFDDVEKIDVSSISNAKKHIISNHTYNVEKHKKENEQSKKYNDLLATLERLDNIKGKINANPNSKHVNIEEELEALCQLAEKLPVIRNACEEIRLRQDLVLLQFDNVENIDISSINNAKNHIWKTNTYNTERKKKENEQSKEYKSLLATLERLDNIKNKINGDPNSKDINIEEELEALRQLAEKLPTIAIACKKIYLKQDLALLQFDNPEKIDVSSISNAKNHICGSRTFQSEKKEEKNKQSKEYKNLSTALKRLDNIKNKINANPNNEDINIEEELKVLRTLVKKSPVIRKACELIRLRQDLVLLQFDNARKIDASSIKNARNHIWNNQEYKRKKKNKGEQDQRYNNYISTLTILNNIQNKLLKPDEKNIDIEEYLADLRTLAEGSRVIKTACEKIRLK